MLPLQIMPHDEGREIPLQNLMWKIMGMKATWCLRNETGEGELSWASIGFEYVDLINSGQLGRLGRKSREMASD